MATAKVAVLSSMAPDQLELFLDQLPTDLEVTAVDHRLSDEEKIALCKDVDAMILAPADVSVNVVRACPRLKLIQT
ncbi:MAG: hypothetical protein V3S37_00180, partial [Dehalococcoidia bacterium]